MKDRKKCAVPGCVNHNDGEAMIDRNGKDLFVARGWGYMTSPGCMNLDNGTAARIQDDMIKEFVDKFNKRWG